VQVDKSTRNLRAKAQSRAYRRLAKAHYAEYDKYYREECASFGLRNHATRAERLAKIKEQLRKLEESAGV
jgi:hypothetical protein